jgi:hypothetical protein
LTIAWPPVYGSASRNVVPTSEPCITFSQATLASELTITTPPHQRRATDDHSAFSTSRRSGSSSAAAANARNIMPVGRSIDSHNALTPTRVTSPRGAPPARPVARPVASGMPAAKNAIAAAISTPFGLTEAKKCSAVGVAESRRAAIISPCFVYR